MPGGLEEGTHQSCVFTELRENVLLSDCVDGELCFAEACLKRDRRSRYEAEVEKVAALEKEAEVLRKRLEEELEEKKRLKVRRKRRAHGTPGKRSKAKAEFLDAVRMGGS